MDARREFADFLVSRRAKLTPEQAGLPSYGGNRRVAGLRREEVALMAGVSIDYYVKLERGNARGVSDTVLEALARALQLDEAERAYLLDLAHTINAAATAPKRTAKPVVRPSVQRILDSMTTTPAYVHNRRLDILAANLLGRALIAPVFDDPRPVHVPRPRHPRLLPRLGAHGLGRGGHPALRSRPRPARQGLQDLIGELSTRSELFRTRWAARNVRLHRTGVKHLHHPVVDELTLDFDAMELPADTGLTVIAYSAGPSSPSADNLLLLASLASTLSQHDQIASGPSEQPLTDRPRP